MKQRILRPYRTYWLLFAASLFAAAVLPPSYSGAGPQQDEQSADRMMEEQILSQMHHMNETAIQAGTLAQQKTESPVVKRYADRLIRDHRIGDEKVSAIAQELGVAVKPPPPQTPGEKQHMQMQMQMMEKLKTLSGKEFDTDFLQMMAQAHEQAITILRGAESRVPAPGLRNLITKMLPILQQDHDLAANLHGSGQ